MNSDRLKGRSPPNTALLIVAINKRRVCMTAWTFNSKGEKTYVK